MPYGAFIKFIFNFHVQSSDVSLVFTPTVRELLPNNLNYHVKYHVKFTNTTTKSISDKTFFIKLSAFEAVSLQLTNKIII